MYPGREILKNIISKGRQNICLPGEPNEWLVQGFQNFRDGHDSSLLSVEAYGLLKVTQNQFKNGLTKR